MSLSAPYFEQLFSANPDPWAFRSRWYEKRKRALTLALLPRQRYGRIFEPACANGELSLGLAERGDRLLCMDLSHTAAALAAERLAGYPEVQVVQGRLPEEWPEGEFDLIVLSELGYYLDSDDWRQVIDQARASLSPQGPSWRATGCGRLPTARKPGNRSTPCSMPTCTCRVQCATRSPISSSNSGAQPPTVLTWKNKPYDRRRRPGSQ